ncbi:hypothetical protein G5C66_08065 [Nocardioides sp. KC13]|uniref:WD40 repeat domain-containing protein n=1 Tax=Nocardioides turkmenicus TaxID=2711220 RepID=A0A6M1QYD2_9ACTN|nr:hypothetical protein [Nocardioides sp. KC13]NGN92690.1 hypothetical protein [Nocardioides sp. KC13]
MKTTLIRVLAGITLAATALSLPTSPASAATDVDVRPGSLPTGDRPAIPYLHHPSDDSWSVVDPKTGMKTPFTIGEADSVTLVGRSGSGFLLRIHYRTDRLIRAELDKPQRTIIDGIHYQSLTKMSADSRYLLTTAFVSNGTQVQVRNAVTGAIVARHTFRNTTEPNPIDVSGTRVLIGGFAPARTMVWNWSTGTIRTIASRAAYTGAFSTDRVATYTRKPFEDGACTVVSSVSQPGTTLWRSCTEAVGAFSPDGARIVTEAIGWVDGATVVRRRSVRGTLLANYRNPNGVWVHGWESSTRVLLESAPYAGSSWLVRCEGTACERAWQAY